ncbi:MAG: ATP-binding cassette domain-containing protein, partial [Bacteroidales bacterium]|nr:ATP-binding cassette domain-containing protein [Bacteroidales bacterium]
MLRFIRRNKKATEAAEATPDTPVVIDAPVGEPDGHFAAGEAGDGAPAEPEKLVLRTDDLVKVYGHRTVVDHVSINVCQGEIVGLLGPNGAGKTTTTLMLLGLTEPTSGHAFINGLN